MRQLFDKRYLNNEDVRAFYDGVDGIYLVAEEDWAFSDEYFKFMNDVSYTNYSIFFHSMLPIDLQLEIVEDYEEVIV